MNRNGFPVLAAAFVVIAAAAAYVAIAAAEPAIAQARHPFAVGGQEATGAAGGFAGFVLAWQSKFHAELQAAARALKTDPAAFFTLAAASFAYGAFHAAGPGHGKAVLASYMLANETALKRGLLLAALAALLQGLVAILLVGAAAAVFRATAAQMTDAARIIEFASYVFIAALGARLVWTKGRALVAALRSSPPVAPAPVPSRGKFVCEAVEESGEVAECPECGLSHAIDPARLSGPAFRWGDAIATVVAAGLRPCSGAILVLVFTLSQGLFAAGVGSVLAMSAGTAITTGALAATAVYAKNAALRWRERDTRRALIIGRGAEFAAAALVLAFGLALLAGIGVSGAAA